MLLHQRLADGMYWDSHPPRLELLRRELGDAWIIVCLYASVVVAPKFGLATRSSRRYVEANTDEAVMFTSLILLSVVLGILIAGGF